MPFQTAHFLARLNIPKASGTVNTDRGKLFARGGKHHVVDGALMPRILFNPRPAVTSQSRIVVSLPEDTAKSGSRGENQRFAPLPRWPLSCVNNVPFLASHKEIVWSRLLANKRLPSALMATSVTRSV